MWLMSVSSLNPGITTYPLNRGRPLPAYTGASPCTAVVCRHGASCGQLSPKGNKGERVGL